MEISEHELTLQLFFSICDLHEAAYKRLVRAQRDGTRREFRAAKAEFDLWCDRVDRANLTLLVAEQSEEWATVH